MRYRTIALLSSVCLAGSLSALDLPESLISRVSAGVLSAPEDFGYHFGRPPRSVVEGEEREESGDYLMVGVLGAPVRLDSMDSTSAGALDVGYVRGDAIRPWSLWAAFDRAVFPASETAHTTTFDSPREKTVTDGTTTQTFQWFADKRERLYRIEGSSRSEASVFFALPQGPLRAGVYASVLAVSGDTADPEAYTRENVDTYETAYVDVAGAGIAADIRVQDVAVTEERHHRYRSQFALGVPLYIAAESSVAHEVGVQARLSVTDDTATYARSIMPGAISGPTTYTTVQTDSKFRDEELWLGASYRAILSGGFGDWRFAASGELRRSSRPLSAATETQQGFSVVPTASATTTTATHRDSYSRQSGARSSLSYNAELAIGRSLYLSESGLLLGAVPEIAVRYGDCAADSLLPLREVEEYRTDENGDADSDDYVDRVTTIERSYTAASAGGAEVLDVAIRLPLGVSLNPGALGGRAATATSILIGGTMTLGYNRTRHFDTTVTCSEVEIQSTGSGEELSRTEAASYPEIAAPAPAATDEVYLEYAFSLGLSVRLADRVRLDIASISNTSLSITNVVIATSIRLR